MASLSHAARPDASSRWQRGGGLGRGALTLAALALCACSGGASDQPPAPAPELGAAVTGVVQERTIDPSGRTLQVTCRGEQVSCV